MGALIAFASGLIFGIGLLLSGMTDPQCILAFLDVAGAWNPALALVMGGAALFWLAFVSVAREGIETALFMYAATGTDSPVATLTGGTIGLLAAVVLGVLVYRGAAHLNLGTFFRITSVLVLAFSAYLLAGALHELGELAGNGALETGAYVVALLYVAGISLGVRMPLSR